MGHNPYIVGLTGNIATGKSTVLAYLAAKGAHVVDADKLAHKTMIPDGAAYEKVVAIFGPEILTPGGQIDRAALGEIVFTDPAKLELLEEIVHPATFELLRWDLTKTDAAVVVLEAIKLLESGRMITLCNEIWAVVSTPEVQLQRLTQQRGMSESEAQLRMDAQPSQAAKIVRADRVIDNSGTLAELYAQLDQLWAELMEKIQTPTRR